MRWVFFSLCEQAKEREGWPCVENPHKLDKTVKIDSGKTIDAVVHLINNFCLMNT